VIIFCAYSEGTFGEFPTYKFHLKIFHNKKTYGDNLICGQGGCPRNFTRFQTLINHIEKVNAEELGTLDHEVDGYHDGVSRMNNDVEELSSLSTYSVDIVESTVNPISILRNSIDEHGVLSDGAQFVAKLRSNPKIPLSAINDIIQCCQELVSPAMCALKD